MTAGKLAVVGTPIGNLEDVTLRALRILRESDLIAAEDTRRTAQLLSRHEIRKPLVSYHEFNEARQTPELLRQLCAGKTIALVSDAGMPTVSDPGLRLIQAVIQAGLTLEIVPGPSAVTTALAGCGLPAQPFLFHGFLPHKSTQRRRVLAELAPLPVALLFFESPHRLLKSLADMEELLGNRSAVVARELTKKFEEFVRGNLADVRKRLEPRAIKGEITVVIQAP